MSNDLRSDKDKVRDFWNRNINQVSFLKTPEIGSRAFFEESEALRYEYHYHLLPLFDQLALQYPKGKLLEVGCSMGTDLLQLARRGFQVTGVDLTTAGIELAKQRFLLYGFDADLRVDDAENLSFKDNIFDVAYSFGVLHHTPDTLKSVNELWRVLRKGGTSVVMLYHRHSLNYVAHHVLNVPADGSRSDPVPVAQTYSRSQVRKLFSKFSEVYVDVDYLFGTGWGVVNRLMPVFFHRFLGRYVGWHLMIRAVK